MNFRKLFALLLTLALATLVAAPAWTAPGPEPKVVSEDDTKWLLGNADVIMKLNLKAFAATELGKTLNKGMAAEFAKSDDKVMGLLKAAGLDPTKDIDTILVSASSKSAEDTTARIVVKGRFNLEKIEATLKKQGEVKFSKEGAIQLFEVPVQGQAMFAAFADKNTLVMTQSKDSTVDAVKTGGKKAAELSAGMKTALGKFTGKEAVAMVFVLNKDLKSALAGTPRVGEAVSKLDMVTASMTFTDSMTTSIQGITGDAKSAGQLAKLLEGLKAAAALAGDDVPKDLLDILDSAKVTSDKESVKIELKISGEMIKKATKGGTR